MENYTDTFSNEEAISRLTALRKEMAIDPSILAKTMGITEDEYMLYEAGLEDIPASVLFYTSLLLTGDPYELFSSGSDAHSSKLKA